MSYLILFLVSFAGVFAQGFQSRNVNTHKYGWAFVTSIAIGVGQGLIWHKVINGSWAEIMIYSLAGGAGITSSMWVHARFFGR